MLHVLSWDGRRASSWAVSIGNVQVVKSGVHGLDTGNSDVDLKSELERRSEICLNLHGTLGFEVHPHCAVGFLRLCHLAYCDLLEVCGEGAALSIGKCQQLVKKTANEGAHANLLEQLGVVRRLEKDAGWVESDWTADGSVMVETSIHDVHIPYHTLKLMLPYVGSDLAVDLPGAQCHGQRISHIRLDLRWNGRVLAGRANPDIGRSLMLELASTDLCNLCSRYQ